MEDRRLLVTLLAFAALLLLAVPAVAHVERASYWPDPAPDCSITPCAGGKVPKIRSLASALDKKLPGKTRVVCQPDSLKQLKASVGAARKNGYYIRPTDHRSVSKNQGAQLITINAALFKMCKYREIQPAVTASGNNDRVVIMPGLYTEPESRAQPTHDPKCASLTQENDRQTDTGGNQSGAVSYAYHMKCPNDQNLVAVMGRANGNGKDPQPPLDERRGIPNLGPCIRCNLQMEGSGATPDDVIVEAGQVKAG